MVKDLKKMSQHKPFILSPKQLTKAKNESSPNNSIFNSYNLKIPPKIAHVKS